MFHIFLLWKKEKLDILIYCIFSIITNYKFLTKLLFLYLIDLIYIF